MNSNPRKFSPSLVIFLALFIGQAVFLAPWVERERNAAGLSYAPEPGLEIPADIRLLETALGGFRGWLINFLWLRAGQLEDEGRAHESMQLARWITRLQPNFPEVWIFQSSNLTLTQSVAATSPEERYLWVDSGIALLRDEAIPINRESRVIYRELSYYFWFKLGDESPDEMREYYWRKIAAEWDQNLGEPHGETGAERAAWLAPLGEAPREVSVLFRRYPELVEEPEERKKIEAMLDGDLRNFLAFVSRGERGHEPYASWLAHAKFGPAREALVAYVRAKVLREQYGMDPLLMIELTQELGPIDWRHPSTHAIYWSAVGELRIETGEAFPRLTDETRESIYRTHFLTLGLRQLVGRGRISGDPVEGELIHAPEFLCIESYERAIFGDEFETATAVPEYSEVPYWRILEAALESAWLRGNDEVAQHCLDRLRRFYEERITDPREWLLLRLEADLPTDPAELATELNGRVAQQYFSMILEGWGEENETVTENRRDLAERLWSRATLGGSTLQSLAELEAEAIEGFLEVSPLVASARSKATAWRKLSAEQRSAVSTALYQALRDSARRAGLDPETSFPRD